ncbi:MAG: DUF929 family protein [Acidimicrobiales bacterium]
MPALVPGEFFLAPQQVSEVTVLPVAVMIAQAKHLPSDATPPQALPAGNPLFRRAGKPAIVYVGAEYCPYCASERWPLVMALSKFGTFHGLRGSSSSPTDVNPSTPSFTFYGSSYTSPYLSFLFDEFENNTMQPLQPLTPLEQALVTKWDTAPYVPAADAGANPIPFVYMAGRYELTGNQFDASSLSDTAWDTAAAYLTSGTNATSKAAEAAAGYLVGDFCALTQERPLPVCSLVPKVLLGITTTTVVDRTTKAVNRTVARSFRQLARR